MCTTINFLRSSSLSIPKKLLFLLLFLNTINCQEYNSVLLVDTFAHKEYAYNTFTSLAKAAGFTVEHCNFYDLKNKEIKNYDALFLLASPAFIENMDKSLLAAETIEKINCFAHTKNKLIGLILPHSIKKLTQYLKFSLKVPREYRDIITWFLLFPVYRKLPYTTTLPPTNEKDLTPQDVENVQYLKEKNDVITAAMLPLHNNLQSSMPYGLYIKNSNYSNHFFLSKIPMLFFSEISEDFRINPIDSTIKLEMLQTLTQTLVELRMLLNDQHIDGSTCLKSTELYVRDAAQHSERNYIYAGWMDIEVFEDALLEKTIQNISQAHLNLLWIRFRPELYFSKNAIGSNKEHYLKLVSNFTKAIQEQYTKLNRPLPKIFIGMEITTNFRIKPVVDSMKDIYATDYSKIPAPLDFENLWRPEVLDAFDAFYHEWQHSVGNGLAIDGIFLDFEMYHAQQQESSYPALCDVSDNAWNIYQSATASVDIKSIRKRIKYVYKTNKFDEYFKLLEHAAYSLGQTIKEQFKTKYPHVSIAAYMPTLPINWFYTGILSGLSSPTEPIILATFNNEFFMHRTFLEENKIYALHMPVMLLSQFTDVTDFKHIDVLLKRHDGVWFNRFSRLSCPYEEKQWWSNEATPLDPDIVIKEIGLKSPQDVSEHHMA